MYGNSQEKSVNKLRTKMLHKMVEGRDLKLSKMPKVDLSQIPPYTNSLIPHIQHVNHRLCCYKNTHVPIFSKPKPDENNQAWEKNNGFLEPILDQSHF